MADEVSQETQQETKEDIKTSQQYINKSAISEWKWRTFVNKISSVLILLLAPFTVAAIISQNAIPGDVLYPLKRGMENMVLAAATVSPATRAAFRTDLAERRFNEAEKLLLTRGDVSGLTTFVSEIQATQVELKQVTDTKKKEELTQKLIVSISEYQTRLVQVQDQVQKQEASQVVPTASPDVSVAPTSSPQEQQPTTTQSRTSITPSTASPTEVHSSISPTHVPTPTIRITTQPTRFVTPSVTRVPSIIPSPTPTPSSPIGGVIGQTREDLDRIRRELEEQQRHSRSVGSQSLAPASAAQNTQSKSKKRVSPTQAQPTQAPTTVSGDSENH